MEDVACLLSLVGAEPKRILEVACGGGRICVPLAQAGHAVMGFDMDGAMLERAKRKAGSTRNLTLYQADALKEGWGKDFDVVVLAGNLLVNIETDGDYQHAQRLFIRKAADCLRPAAGCSWTSTFPTGLISPWTIDTSGSALKG